ncbi:unnamed protein product [Thlaspi arvense]|uniref:Glabrous enhancer-binding protein-like DBD domain-containing protein n=1 Tax=Thlaspi arvense TaxID=13288 RepID=A0AAU9S0K2_THLAR|nr:unnamed protein product [Thlaspi arvense]
MSNKKRLPSRYALSDTDTSDEETPLNAHVTPPAPPQSPVFKSPESSGEKTPDSLRSRKKRKATLTCLSQDPKRIWSLNDELVILKGIVNYRNETGVDYLSDSGAFLNYIKNDIESSRNSKRQLVSKIRKLKQKFRDNLAKSPCFTINSHDSEIFNLSAAIWGNDKADCVDVNMDKANASKSKVQAFVEHEAEDDDGSAKGESFDKLPYENVDKSRENEAGGKGSEELEEAATNGKLENDDGSAKGDSCDERLPSEKVDKRMEEKEDGGKESEGDDADDEMSALQDVLETTMFQNLSIPAQKLMLRKLKTLGGKERKALSDEWKALLVQELLLKSKKQTFAAKLAKAASHDD